jgi:hypothetical protein
MVLGIMNNVAGWVSRCLPQKGEGATPLPPWLGHDVGKIEQPSGRHWRDYF